MLNNRYRHTLKLLRSIICLFKTSTTQFLFYFMIYSYGTERNLCILGNYSKIFYHVKWMCKRPETVCVKQLNYVKIL